MPESYTTTPEAAPHVRATLDLHRATLQRAAEQNRAATAQQAAQRDATAARTTAYLTGTGEM